MEYISNKNTNKKKEVIRMNIFFFQEWFKRMRKAERSNDSQSQMTDENKNAVFEYKLRGELCFVAALILLLMLIFM
jgi:hypothetical protein